MTRAALLHLLDSPASISAAAVQDLEQLAQAFPYCQTAHLLLAKAAHDQGSMLAGQRLRRAATYATDRQLLRQLLAQPPAAAPVAASVSSAPAAPSLTVESALVVEEAVLAADAAEPAALAAGLEPVAEGVGTETAALAAEPAEEIGHSPHAETAAGDAPDNNAEEGASAGPPEVGLASVPPLTEEEAPAPARVASELLADLTEAMPAVGAEPEPIAEPAESVHAAPVIAAPPAAATDEPAEPEAASLPPIRPPAEAGTARFEFGLSAPALEAEFTSYQLAELPAEEPVVFTASRPAPVPPEPGPGAFRGADDLAYALGGGSRLGYALQAALPAAPVADVDVPGTTLPPAGEFFAPDALLLEHLVNQPPPAPPVPSSLDLIDSFLRRAPQRRRGIVTLLTVPEQADLSMRSTRAEPDLASENLARILAGQGKTERAIAVYKLLMVRQPEKSAYFAVQIDLLRNPPTPSS
ncbi:hypothetical protein [uncultured Hymenobacter sp.]|uniref:hypothetical protein n=1 Tax=uncultured Hymenobacter sp. TaxID=170016 RepID=UPI0035C948FB